MEKNAAEQKVDRIANDIADDMGLIMDKTIRLEWYKVANTRTRCLRITQVPPPPHLICHTLSTVVSSTRDL